MAPSTPTTAPIFERERSYGIFRECSKTVLYYCRTIATSSKKIKKMNGVQRRIDSVVLQECLVRCSIAIFLVLFSLDLDFLHFYFSRGPNVGFPNPCPFQVRQTKKRTGPTGPTTMQGQQVCCRFTLVAYPGRLHNFLGS